MTQTAHPFDILNDEQYMSLTTVRKSGKAVPTPVWFAREGDTIYVYTRNDSGKVKRIRHTPQVSIAACDARGNVHSDTRTAHATLHDKESQTGQHANRLLNKKYGLMKRAFDLMGMFSGGEAIFIAIKPQ